MAAEVFWDTSGFFALLNTDDPAHAKARHDLALRTWTRGSATTEHNRHEHYTKQVRQEI